MNLPRNRAGFTLIELLVVTGLILVLATLTVGIVANSMDQDRVRQGADQMQGWLVMAKQWAMRNKVPTGIRLVPDPTTGLITQAQFIEQPEDFNGPAQASLSVWDDRLNQQPPANLNLPTVASVLGSDPNNQSDGLGTNGVVIFAYFQPNLGLNQFVDFTGGNPGFDPNAANPLPLGKLTQLIPDSVPGNPNKKKGKGKKKQFTSFDTGSWPVQVGDWLELRQNGVAQLFQVQCIYGFRQTVNGQTLPAQPALYCSAADPLTSPPANHYQTNWSIVRQIRPKLGEQPLLFPKDVVMDSGATQTYAAVGSSPIPGYAYDLVFKPDGTVMANGDVANSVQQVYLWFRDVSKDALATNRFSGKQFIVTVNPSNGFIATHPVDETIDPRDSTRYANPFAFSQDGLSSGL